VAAVNETDKVSNSSVRARVGWQSSQITGWSHFLRLLWGTTITSGLFIGCTGAADCAAACQPSPKFPPIRLASGQTLAVVDRYDSGSGGVLIDYISAQDGLDLHEMCAEVKEVWESIREELTLQAVTKVSFGVTNPRKEFAGMRWFVIPVFTCCRSMYLTIELTDEGEWQFRNCP